MMRRSLSIFVLVLLLAPLALPLTLAAGAPALPLCCRAGGAHHCSGLAGLSLPGKGFRDAAHNCPYSHPNLLSNSLRPQAPAAVPTPRPAHALRGELGRVYPAAPVAGHPSSRAPPALSSL